MTEKDPADTNILPDLPKQSTSELRQTRPIGRHPSRISQFEYYAFFAVVTLVVLSGFVIPQPILDQYEISIMLFVVIPAVTWSMRIYFLR